MTIEWHLKSFEQLNKIELYQWLQLRSEVFVVSQTSIYQDLDDLDQFAWHLLAYDGDTLIAGSRIFAPNSAGNQTNYAKLGRVLVKETHRNQALGKMVMQKTLSYIKQHFPTHDVYIYAQAYLRKFYRDFDFKEIGDEYMLDGIAHIDMVRLATSVQRLSCDHAG